VRLFRRRRCLVLEFAILFVHLNGFLYSDDVLFSVPCFVFVLHSFAFSTRSVVFYLVTLAFCFVFRFVLFLISILTLFYLFVF